MSDPMLPRAGSLPRLPSKRGKGQRSGAVRRRHEQAAVSALVATRGGGGMVIVKRMGTKTPGKSAARIAKAWNAMVDAAEQRHERFWAEYDQQGDLQ